MGSKETSWVICKTSLGLGLKKREQESKKRTCEISSPPPQGAGCLAKKKLGDELHLCELYFGKRSQDVSRFCTMQRQQQPTSTKLSFCYTLCRLHRIPSSPKYGESWTTFRDLGNTLWAASGGLGCLWARNLQHHNLHPDQQVFSWTSLLLFCWLQFPESCWFCDFTFSGCHESRGKFSSPQPAAQLLRMDEENGPVYFNRYVSNLNSPLPLKICNFPHFLKPRDRLSQIERGFSCLLIELLSHNFDLRSQ